MPETPPEPAAAPNFAARSNWSKVAASRRPSWRRQRAPWRGIRLHRKSALAQMLSPRSTAGFWWFKLQTLAVVTALATHFASTVKGVVESHARLLDVLEVVTSLAFTLDFLARLITCPEHNRWSHLAPMAARLRWACTWEALISAISCVPIFAESSCLLYTSPSPRDRQKSRMPSSA